MSECHRTKSLSEKQKVLKFVAFLTRFLGCLNVRACLHGGGGPQVGEVTRLGGVTRLSM